MQAAGSAFAKVWEVDSRFGGNDLLVEKGPVPNDTTTGSSRATRRA
jgi:hypothetical protein